MNIQKLISVMVLIFLIAGCAGIGIKPDARSAFKEGLALFNLGKYEEAVHSFERAADIDPEYAEAYLYLGRSYLNLSMWLEAVPPLRTAFRLSPDESRKEVLNVLVDALFGAAILEFKKGNYQNSADFLKDILNLAPESVKAKKELIVSLIAHGGELLSEGRAAEAIDVFKETIALSPDNLKAYIGLAKAFFENGDFFDALKAIRDAVSLDPASTEATSFMKEIMNRSLFE